MFGFVITGTDISPRTSVKYPVYLKFQPMNKEKDFIIKNLINESG